MNILLTGATGYVGGRLLKELEAAGEAVRCLTRRRRDLTGRVSAGTEVVEGDIADAECLAQAMAGVSTAYYLVHSMGSASGFEERDREMATGFAAAARAAGVKRIIYLGGLAPEREKLSAHLRSRLEVGRILRASGIPTIELQASIIIGSGSLSFELIRNLVERLPVMIMPRWVRVKAQPISIDDVLDYLMRARQIPLDGCAVYEIGGADVVSYAEIMREYARQRGLRRLMVPVPVLTPWLSSIWLNLVTPVYARIGRKLIDSIRHPTVVRCDDARRDFGIQPVGIDEAIRRAIGREERQWRMTRWSDSIASVGGHETWGGVRFGNRIIDHRMMVVPVPAEKAFVAIRKIGGATGWYCGNPLWRARGMIDSLCGGVGLRRGRRDPDELRVGDALDFWRVELYEPDRRLRLAAEMKLPGRAWLEFEVRPCEGGCEVHQSAMFDPRGLAGQLYWYSLYPLHRLIFAGMLRNIALRGTR